MGDGSVALLDFGEKPLLRLRAEVLRGRDAMSPELTLRSSEKNFALPSLPGSLALFTRVSSASSAGVSGFVSHGWMSQNLRGLGARTPFTHSPRCPRVAMDTVVLAT